MNYKEERHEKLECKLRDKMKDVPEFVADYFLDGSTFPSTRLSQWSYVQNLLDWMIRNKYIKAKSIGEITKKQLNGIKSDVIDVYFKEIEEQSTKSSIMTKRRVFNCFWKYLQENKYVSKNIISRTKKYREGSKSNFDIVVPDKELIERFISNVEKIDDTFLVKRNKAIIRLMCGSGIRSEELMNLDMSDLDLDGKYPQIRIVGKGHMNYDTVDISNQARDSMKEYIEERNKWKDGDIHTNAVFVSKQNKRLSKNAITNIFIRYCDGEITPHQLRHFCGTTIYENTGDITRAQVQLRHANSETTKKFYVNVSHKILHDTVADICV